MAGKPRDRHSAIRRRRTVGHFDVRDAGIVAHFRITKVIEPPANKMLHVYHQTFSLETAAGRTDQDRLLLPTQLSVMFCRCGRGTELRALSAAGHVTKTTSWQPQPAKEVLLMVKGVLKVPIPGRRMLSASAALKVPPLWCSGKRLIIQHALDYSCYTERAVDGWIDGRMDGGIKECPRTTAPPVNCPTPSRCQQSRSLHDREAKRYGRRDKLRQYHGDH